MEEQSSFYEQTVVEYEDFPGLYLGMALRVMTLDNRLIYMGRIEGIQGSTIQISNDKGGLVPAVVYGTKIKLRGFYHYRPITLEGEITGSTDQFWWAGKLQSLQGAEQREFFRQYADMECQVMCANRVFGHGEGPAGEGIPYPCKIVDISAGGTMLSTDADFQVGDRVLLVNVKMFQDSPPLTFTCVVRRVLEEDGKKRFGCEFYSLNGKEREQLIQAIFVFQQKEMAEQRRDD